MALYKLGNYCFNYYYYSFISYIIAVLNRSVRLFLYQHLCERKSMLCYSVCISGVILKCRLAQLCVFVSVTQSQLLFFSTNSSYRNSNHKAF